MATIKADLFWHDFFYTELTTDLRRGEICGLQWKDFDSEAGTLQVSRTLHGMSGSGFEVGETKTGTGKRKILLPESTADIFREQQKAAPGEWIFFNPLRPKQPISPDAAYRRLKTPLKQTDFYPISRFITSDTRMRLFSLNFDISTKSRGCDKG